MFSRKSGFTLLELVIVIIIIAVLLLVAFPNFMRMIERSRGSEAYVMIDAIKKAQTAYFIKEGEYENAEVDAATNTWATGTFIPLEVPEAVGSDYWEFHTADTGSGYNVVAYRVDADGDAVEIEGEATPYIIYEYTSATSTGDTDSVPSGAW